MSKRKYKTVALIFFCFFILLFYFSFFEEKRSTVPLFFLSFLIKKKREKREIAVFSSLSHLQRQVQNCFGEPLHRPKNNYIIKYTYFF